MTNKSGKLMVLVGSSRSGKTQKALDELKRHDRVLVWDVEGHYECDYRATNQADFSSAVGRSIGHPVTIAYTGSLKDFDYFCAVAFWWVKVNSHLGAPCAVVAEETADVTSPNKAPEAYGILLRRGLKYGVDIFAITQRPAESDKTSVGNASVVHICRMNLPIDREYMARMTGVPLAEIEVLAADQDAGKFDYITVDTGRREYRRGRLTFTGKAPVFTLNSDVVSLQAVRIEQPEPQKTKKQAKKPL